MSARAQIIAGLAACGRLNARELFDAIGAPPEKLYTYAKALSRLVADGTVERIGESKPYHYRLPEGKETT